jgi:hypothetical protein
VNLFKKLFALIGIVSVAGGMALTVPAHRAFAQAAGDPNAGKFSATKSKIPLLGTADFSKATDGKTAIVTLANNAISLILLIIGIVAVFYLIFAGFQYLTAGGDADKVKKARAGIVNAVIGIVIILSAFLIVRFAVNIGNTVGTSDGSNTTTGGSGGGLITP